METPVAMAVDTAMAVDLAPIMAVVMEPDMAVDIALAVATGATGHCAIEDVTLLAVRTSLSKSCLHLK